VIETLFPKDNNQGVFVKAEINCIMLGTSLLRNSEEGGKGCAMYGLNSLVKRPKQQCTL
jgi:hypothetical protein